MSGGTRTGTETGTAAQASGQEMIYAQRVVVVPAGTLTAGPGQVLVSPDGLSFRPCWPVMNVDGIWMVDSEGRLLVA